MTIPVVITCPLGSTCEKVVDNAIHRCMWYTCLAGQNPQTGEMIDEWKCAMSWIPIMLVENANTNRGQTAAMESFRNEVVTGQNVFNMIAAQAATNNLLENKKGT